MRNKVVMWMKFALFLGVLFVVVTIIAVWAWTPMPAKSVFENLRQQEAKEALKSSHE
jgi:hypothetical protein